MNENYKELQLRAFRDQIAVWGVTGVWECIDGSTHEVVGIFSTVGNTISASSKQRNQFSQIDVVHSSTVFIMETDLIPGLEKDKLIIDGIQYLILPFAVRQSNQVTTQISLKLTSDKNHNFI